MKSGKIIFLLPLFLFSCGGNSEEKEKKSGVFSDDKKTLTIRNENLKKIPDWVFEETQLHELVLEKNELTFLPPEIGKLDRLLLLDADQNKLEKIPDKIGNLIYLLELDLDHNQLSELPASIGKLKLLTDFDIENNKLEKLPKEIGQLENLHILDIDVNLLTSLPEEIGQLKTLYTLHADFNQLESLPSSIGGLTQLEELSLFENKLKSLPASIGQMHALRNLNLSTNDLTELPHEIGNLDSLESLNLSNNQLTVLPAEIGNLKKLHYLDISGNPLKSIPEELGNLTQLREFYYDSAQFHLLPESVFALGILPQRFIHHIPSSIAGKPVSYYQNNPDIDTLSKMYIRRELDLRKGDLRQILECVLSSKPENRGFYFFMFNSILVHYKFSNDTTESEFPDKISPKGDVEHNVSLIASDYLVNDPCLFFSEVKYGRHKALYEMLKLSALGRLPYGFLKDIDAEVRQKINSSCGGKYNKDWEEIVNLQRAEWEREKAEAEAMEE